MDLIPVQQCLNTGVMTEVLVPSKTDDDKWYNVLVQDPDDINDVICECRGYEVRGHCSHQAEALAVICRWDEAVGPEEQTADQRRTRICPRCGGPTTKTLEAT